jgi:hypothetical protein
MACCRQGEQSSSVHMVIRHTWQDNQDAQFILGWKDGGAADEQ